MSPRGFPSRNSLRYEVRVIGHKVLVFVQYVFKIKSEHLRDTEFSLVRVDPSVMELTGRRTLEAVIHSMGPNIGLDQFIFDMVVVSGDQMGVCSNGREACVVEEVEATPTTIARG